MERTGAFAKWKGEHGSRLKAYLRGLGITLTLAVLAKGIAHYPIFSIMGPLVVAILLGMAVRAVRGYPGNAEIGIVYSTKQLLRYGIILLGMRLNLTDILHAGPKIFVVACVDIAVTILAVYGIARYLQVSRTLGLLTACGTAICGAAAIMAIRPQLQANEDDTAVSAVTIAILGTVFTVCFTFVYPFLGLTPIGYGVFSGATLHEVAHVLAAAAPAGSEAVDMAVIVKLTRVLLLVPVAILLGMWMNAKNGSARAGSLRKIPVPWFILGFFGTSALNSLEVVPQAVANHAVQFAYLLMAMAMAGLGLQVNLKAFRNQAGKIFFAGFAGSILLTALGYLFVHVLKLN